MWFLNPDKELENNLDLKIPIESDDALLPKKWLTSGNWILYQGQVIEQVFHWKNEKVYLPLKTTRILKEQGKNLLKEMLIILLQKQVFSILLGILLVVK